MSAAGQGASDAVARGSECLRQGQFDEAISSFQEALTQDPGSSAAHMGLGVACSQVGRHDEAVASLTRAAEIDSGNATVHYNLGMAYESAGHAVEAERSYRAALALNPNYPLAQKALGGLRARGARTSRTPISDQGGVAKPVMGDRVLCVSCAQDMPASDRFCPVCGADQREMVTKSAVQAQVLAEKPAPTTEVESLAGAMSLPAAQQEPARSRPGDVKDTGAAAQQQATQPTTAVAGIRTCQCGAVLEEGLKFCNRCGRPTASATGVTPAGGKRFCTKCGVENPAQVRFCTSCGAALTEVQSGGTGDAVRAVGVSGLPVRLPSFLGSTRNVVFALAGAMFLATFLSWVNAGFSGSMEVTGTEGPYMSFKASMNLWEMFRQGGQGGRDWVYFLLLSFFFYPPLGVAAELQKDRRNRSRFLTIVGALAVVACLIAWVSSSREWNAPQAAAMGLSVHLGVGFFIYLLLSLGFLGTALYTLAEPG